MKIVKKAVANVGKYTDSTGQEKNRYLTIGKLMQRDDGSHCLKIDSLPVGGDFTGWVSFYDLDEPKQAPEHHASDDSEIPF